MPPISDSSFTSPSEHQICFKTIFNVDIVILKGWDLKLVRDKVKLEVRKCSA